MSGFRRGPSGFGNFGKRKAFDDYGGPDKYPRGDWGGGGGYYDGYGDGYGGPRPGYGGGPSSYPAYGGGGGYNPHKEMQKMEMMKQIAQLESELDADYYNDVWEGDRGWRGGRRDRMNEDWRGSDRRSSGGRSDGGRRSGRGSGKGSRSLDDEQDPYYDSYGRGVRIQSKTTPDSKQAKPGPKENRYRGRNRGKDKQDRMETCGIPSKETVQKLMHFMKSFPDKDDPISTVLEGVEASGVNVEATFRSAYVYLDGLIIGHSLQKPIRFSAFRDALTCLRRNTVDELFARSEKLLKNEERIFLHATLVSPISFSEKPFEERLSLLMDEIKDCDRIGTTFNVFCAKYFIKLAHLIVKLPTTGAPKEDLFDSRLYANELFLANARGRTTNNVTFNMYNNVKTLFAEKTVEDILQHEKSFEDDLKNMTVESIMYRGCGAAEEDNVLQLRAFRQLHQWLPPPKLEELVLIDKDAWSNSPFEAIEEGCRRCGLTMKWSIDTVPPSTVKLSDYRVLKEKEPKSEMVCQWFSSISKAISTAKVDKLNLFTCKLEIEGTKIGEGVGTTRKEAIRSSAYKALSSLVKTQTIVRFSNKKMYAILKEIQFNDMKQEAIKLREEMPEPPNFDDFFMDIDEYHDKDEDDENQDGLEPKGMLVGKNDNDGDKKEEISVKTEDAGVKTEETSIKEEQKEEENSQTVKNEDGSTKEEGEKDDKSDKNSSIDAKKKARYSLTDPFLADMKELEELMPWIKEVIKRKMEAFINSESFFSVMVFNVRQPDFVRLFIRVCCYKYRLFTLRNRNEKTTKIVIQRNNPNFTLKQIAEKLVNCESNSKDGYTLIQMRQDNGIVKQYQSKPPRRRR
ncbi:hypothetical protein SNE40_000491 [Patella caerulea]|uniref:DRBM domain-containing protein n=1 Tax=Patella caerulea TaxID=87958 RepID=A0AAN8Q740_PATCE